MGLSDRGPEFVSIYVCNVESAQLCYNFTLNSSHNVSENRSEYLIYC